MSFCLNFLNFIFLCSPLLISFWLLLILPVFSSLPSSFGKVPQPPSLSVLRPGASSLLLSPTVFASEFPAVPKSHAFAVTPSIVNSTDDSGPSFIWGFVLQVLELIPLHVAVFFLANFDCSIAP